MHICFNVIQEGILQGCLSIPLFVEKDAISISTCFATKICEYLTHNKQTKLNTPDDSLKLLESITSGLKKLLASLQDRDVSKENQQKLFRVIIDNIQNSFMQILNDRRFNTVEDRVSQDIQAFLESKGFKAKLMEHQFSGVRFLVRNIMSPRRGCLLCAGMVCNNKSVSYYIFCI